MHYDWKLAAAEREFQRTLTLNPSYATAHQWRALNTEVARGPSEESGMNLPRAA
jgi:hypothetical protein